MRFPLLLLLLAAPAFATPLQEVEDKGLAPVETAPAEPAPTVVLTGATVMTATGEVHSPGWVVLRSGEIAGVGAGEPPDTKGVVVDATGKFITPGLIDTHSHLGVYPSPGARAHSDGNEATAPTTPGVWAEHSAWPQDPGFERAVAGGVTSMLLLPGSANLIGGRGVVVQAVPTRGSRAMRLDGAPEAVKMACGENPKRVYGGKGGPSTRMGNLRSFRSAFMAAAKKKKEWDEAAEKAEQPAKGKKKGKKGEEPEDEAETPERNLDLETLVGVLNGDILVNVHCYRADDMLSVLQVADEFGFEVRSFHHALEAYKIRDVLAEKNVAINTWADWWGFKLEAYDAIPENLAMMHDAGGISVVHSDSPIGIQRLNQEAGKAQASGRAMGIDISDDEALGWITKNAAWVMGIDDITGTLEAGKRGDVVVWDGHPLSVYSSAELVFIGGRLRYDKARPQTWSDFELGQEDVQ
jgi:imidazolonepropionase-like amidohydrolase